MIKNIAFEETKVLDKRKGWRYFYSLIILQACILAMSYLVL